MEIKLIRFRGGLVCPYCQGRQVVLWGKRNQIQRYRCRNCRKLFNDLTGTPMAHSKLLDKWPKASAALQQSLTVREAAKYLGVCIDTSFRWRHRLLAGVKKARSQVRLSGIVEIDETYFPYSEKGARGMACPPRKRGRAAHVRGRDKAHVCAVIARDRTTQTRSFLLPRLSGAALAKEVGSALDASCVLCSDYRRSYRTFAIKLGFRHVSLNMSRGKMVVHGIYHIKSVNSYHARLKSWIRRFRGVATKYLPNYLAWQEHLDESRKLQHGLGEQKLFITAVSATCRRQAA